MKGLKKIPPVGKIHAAVNRLQADLVRDLPTHAPSRIALLTQWSRFDGRLAEVLAQYILRFFKKVNWPEVWSDLQLAPWPQVLEVLLRFCEAALKDRDREFLQGLIWTQRKIFPATSGGLFFIPLQRQPFVTTDAEITWSLWPYRAAGFIGSLPLIKPAKGASATTFLNPTQRLRLLEKLQTTDGSFRVEDYIVLCRGLVSRRQAQRDLAAAHLKTKGFTRRKKYSP